MNNIHCMYCGHTIELGGAYDDYQGPLRCSVCKRLMMVRVDEGQLRAMAPGPDVDPAPPATAPTPIPEAATAKGRPSHPN